MGFYFRKSVSLGALRLNFSTGGVGASIGVKGLRLGIGPSGTYVRAGLGGLYYRASLGSGRTSAATTPRLTQLQREIDAARPQDWKEIESGSAELMVDATAEHVLDQLRRRNEGTYWCMAIGIGGAILALVLANAGNFFDGKDLVRARLSGQQIALRTLSVVVLIATVAGAIWGYLKDAAARGGVAFLYDLDSDVQQAVSDVYSAIEKIANAPVRFHCLSAAKVEYGKSRYHGGANRLISTNALNIELNAPPRVSANVPIPAIPAGHERLCIFPERLIVLQGSGRSEIVGAVPYSQLDVEVSCGSFTLQSEDAPRGTQFIGHTWQYVNNNGSPDRRFKNNRKLARISSETVRFRSSSGLNEEILHSDIGAGTALQKAIQRLAKTLADSEQSRERSDYRSAPETSEV